MTRGRFRPQQPGDYVTVYLIHPAGIGFGGEPMRQRTLRLAGPIPENVQTLPDGAILVIASLRPDGNVETFHFPARSISHWSTYTITEEQYAADLSAEERALGAPVKES